MPTQKGGGSVGQSLRYVDPAAPEQSAGAGFDLLKSDGLIARPAIGGGTRKKKGGFYPSVMSGVVNAGVVLAPLTAVAARKLFSRKTRKGGTRRGNRWAAEKEEAKRILEGIGKPSAKNVLAFAAAKRRGSTPTEEYLEQFRKRVQEKKEANESRRAAKEAKKAARAAKKASKKAKKESVAAPPSAESNSSSNNNNNNARAPTQAQLRREAEANAAAAAAEMKAAKGKRPVKNSQLAWFTLIDNAQKRLAANGTPTRKNAMKYASLLKQGKNAEAEAFLANFRARSRKSNKKSGIAAASGNAAAPKKSRKIKTAAAVAEPKKSRKVNAGPKKSKEHSAASKRYFEELKTARQLLGEVGHPTGPNMSKFASMRLKGENTTQWLENFKSRRPKSLASAKPAKKGKAAAAAPALSAVVEGNESENENNANSMQGYSENFESED